MLSEAKFKEEQTYLAGVNVTEDTPAVLLDWDDNIVASFVEELKRTKDADNLPFFLEDIQTAAQLKNALIDRSLWDNSSCS